jgi:hypothetical protein
VLAPPLLSRIAFLAPLAPPEGDPGEAVIGLYTRVFVMQVAIIGGGWLAMLVGGHGTLLLLIVAKTLVELRFQPIVRKVDTAVARAAAERDGAAKKPGNR